MSEKKFGLVIPKKADKFKILTNSVFGDDSDEDEKERRRPKIPQKTFGGKSKVKQESSEDPSIYEYDNIYDEMKAKEAESIVPKEKKNSRYIETLLKAAEKRKKEYERRVDKKIQAEREKEGDLYKDKEAFVTSSYKKKLQEKEEEEERERRENMLNDMMDITKQKDLSGFYRHFLKQTVGEEKVPVFGEKYVKQEVRSSKDDSSEKVLENVKDNKNFDHTSIDQDSDGIDIDSESEGKNSDTNEEIPSKKCTVIENTTHRCNDSEEEGQRSKFKKSIFEDKSKYLQQRKKLKTRNQKTSNFSNSESSDNEDVKHSKKSFHSDNRINSEANIHQYRHDSSSSDDSKMDFRSSIMILSKRMCLICKVEKKPLFSFPKNCERLMVWLRCLHKTSLLEEYTETYNNGHLCALHFEEKDFLSILKKRLSFYSVLKSDTQEDDDCVVDHRDGVDILKMTWISVVWVDFSMVDSVSSSPIMD